VNKGGVGRIRQVEYEGQKTSKTSMYNAPRIQANSRSKRISHSMGPSREIFATPDQETQGGAKFHSKKKGKRGISQAGERGKTDGHTRKVKSRGVRS